MWIRFGPLFSSKIKNTKGKMYVFYNVKSWKSWSHVTHVFAMAISKIIPSQEISILPSHFIPNHRYASINWDDGKEVCILRHWELESRSHITQIRLYHLGSGNILQEHTYSESEINSSYFGDLRNLNIVLDVRHQDDGISIFFQG